MKVKALCSIEKYISTASLVAAPFFFTSMLKVGGQPFPEFGIVKPSTDKALPFSCGYELFIQRCKLLQGMWSIKSPECLLQLWQIRLAEAIRCLYVLQISRFVSFSPRNNLHLLRNILSQQGKGVVWPAMHGAIQGD